MGRMDSSAPYIRVRLSASLTQNQHVLPPMSREPGCERGALQCRSGVLEIEGFSNVGFGKPCPVGGKTQEQ